MSDGQILATAPTAPAEAAAPATTTPAVTPQPGAPTGTTQQEGSILPGAADEPKPTTGEQAKANTPPAPDIEVKLPEGVEADPVLMDALKGVAKEAGLKGEHAQKLADAYIAAQTKAQEGMKAAWETRKQEWISSVKNDEEIGGAKFGESVKIANRALDKYGSKELRQMLEDTGLNNHPEVARLFTRIGRTLMEDSIAGTGVGPTGNTSSEESVLRSMYPTMFKAKE